MRGSGWGEVRGREIMSVVGGGFDRVARLGGGVGLSIAGDKINCLRNGTGGVERGEGVGFMSSIALLVTVCLVIGIRHGKLHSCRER